MISRDAYGPVYQVVNRGNQDELQALPVRGMVTDEEPDDFDTTLICIHPDDLGTAVRRVSGRFRLTPTRIWTSDQVEGAGLQVFGFNGVPAGSSDFYVVFGAEKQVAFNPVSLLIGHNAGQSQGGYEFGKALAFEIRKEGIGQIFHANEINVPTVD